MAGLTAYTKSKQATETAAAVVALASNEVASVSVSGLTASTVAEQAAETAAATAALASNEVAGVSDL